LILLGNQQANVQLHLPIAPGPIQQCLPMM
jgi:hypothetical protein